MSACQFGFEMLVIVGIASSAAAQNNGQAGAQGAQQNGQAGAQGEQQNGQAGYQGEQQNGQAGAQGDQQNGQAGQQGENNGQGAAMNRNPNVAAKIAQGQIPAAARPQLGQGFVAAPVVAAPPAARKVLRPRR